MRTAIRLYVAVILGLSATAIAQEFEVASVKASDSADAARLRAQDFAATVMAPGAMPVNNPGSPSRTGPSRNWSRWRIR